MSENRLTWKEWLTIGILAAAMLMFLTCAGCQWSAYNSVSYDRTGKVNEKVGVGTIEFFVIDSKKGLQFKTYEGTELTLASTDTDPDAEAMRVLAEAIDQWLTVLSVPIGTVTAPTYGVGQPAIRE